MHKYTHLNLYIGIFVHNVYYRHMNTSTEETKLVQATETLRAIAHPIRISIIQLLHAHGQLTVTELFTKLDIEQAIAELVVWAGLTNKCRQVRSGAQS